VVVRQRIRTPRLPLLRWGVAHAQLTSESSLPRCVTHLIGRSRLVRSAQLLLSGHAKKNPVKLRPTPIPPLNRQIAEQGRPDFAGRSILAG